MNMENFIPVNLIIGDRSYRVKVKTEDEEAVRKIAKQLNDKLRNFKAEYSGKDMQDYLAMVLLSFVTETQSNETPAEDNTGIEFLDKVEALLDKALERGETIKD
jgi:cell division protein ZapA